jgi:hypothetical protein
MNTVDRVHRQMKRDSEVILCFDNVERVNDPLIGCLADLARAEPRQRLDAA